jgi:hypothetical protein
MFCSSCGKEVVPISQVCVHCGAPHGLAIVPLISGNSCRKVATVHVVGYLCLGLIGMLALIGIVNRVSNAFNLDKSVLQENTVVSPKSISSVPTLFELNQRVVVPDTAGCAPKLDDFNLMVTAIWNQDRPALLSLVNQGRVLFIDPGTSAEVVTTNPAKHRTSIYIGSGAHIGRTCYMATEQLRASSTH